MDNTLVYEAGDCGSIPYAGAKSSVVVAGSKPACRSSEIAAYDSLTGKITTQFMLGYSLVWSKATVFEIVITGSNPVTSAKFSG
jgi:hypothetical protein